MRCRAYIDYNEFIVKLYNGKKEETGGTRRPILFVRRTNVIELLCYAYFNGEYNTRLINIFIVFRFPLPNRILVYDTFIYIHISLVMPTVHWNRVIPTRVLFKESVNESIITDHRPGGRFNLPRLAVLLPNYGFGEILKNFVLKKITKYFKILKLLTKTNTPRVPYSNAFE